MNHPNLTQWVNLAGMLTSSEYSGKRIIVCSSLLAIRRLEFEKAAAESHGLHFRLYNDADVQLVGTLALARDVAGTQPDLVILDGDPNDVLFAELHKRLLGRNGEMVTLQAALQHYGPAREPA